MKDERFQLYTTKVIPIDSIISREKVDFRKLYTDAKIYPLHFAFELFSIFVMAVGAYAIGEWAFELGFYMGRWAP